MSNYNNPRDSQMFGQYSQIDREVVPLPPCKDAYSIGPSSADTSLEVAWISTGYNFSDSVDMSVCGLIKDENDVFYYAVAYDLGGGTRIFVDEYKAASGTSTAYEITPPAQLSTLVIDSCQIFIRKKSATTMDIVFFGNESGGGVYDVVLQHYLWTIGSNTMSHVYSNSYGDVGGESVGNAIARALQGPLVINFHRFSSGTTDTKLFLTTYNLNTQVFSEEKIFDETDYPLSNLYSFDYGFYHGGNAIYVLYFVSFLDADVLCTVFPTLILPMRISVVMSYAGYCFSLDGSSIPMSGMFATAAGRHALINGIILGKDYSANPDTGDVYLGLKYYIQYSFDMDCKKYFNPPDVTLISSGVLRLTANGNVLTDGPGITTSMLGNDDIYAGHVNSFSSRSDPMSLINDGGNTYLLHWSSRNHTAENVFTASPYSSGGSGQRNDNQPEVFCKINGTSNEVYSDAGNLILTQTTTLGVSASNFLPVTGYYGKYPVRHRTGRWAIFGPSVPEVTGGHWYVV